MTLKHRIRPQIGEKKPSNQATLFEVSAEKPPAKLLPFKSIYVHFESHEDMEDFARLIGQKVDRTTPEVWFPELAIAEIKNA